MKTNTLHFSRCFKSVIMAIALLLVTETPVKAQDSIRAIDDFVLNGLFTPTASQRFFEAGRDNFERETRILEDPERYFDGDILDIAPEVIQQMKGNKTSLDLWIIDPSDQLYLDKE